MNHSTLRDLNRYVRICASDDVITDGTLCLRRRDVRATYAAIEPLSRNVNSVSGASWSANGKNVEDKPTHNITVRAMPELELTRTAWLFEERRVSANRWYKVLQTQESEDLQWWSFRVVVDSRTDTITPVEDDEPRKKTGLARQVRL